MVVFISNFYNHHQAPFSEAVYRLTKGEYRFIATEPIEEERIKMGWGGENASFVLQYSENVLECKKLIDGAETVIFGSAPYCLIKDRLKQKKLTFIYSERIYKRKCPFWQIPLRAIKYYFKWGRYSNLYLLCASAYTASDYAKTRTFIGKSYKWGYFPEAKQYTDIQKLINSKEKNSILWCARLIDWKHPELPILIAKRLKDDGYSFTLNLIGNGNMEATIQQMIVEQGVSDCVHMLGAMKPAQVREYMDKSQIFLFTSDRNEGWGAVLNEAMNSGCAVIANKNIGSVPYLIKNGENGLVFEIEEELYCHTKYLLENFEKCESLGISAYKTITEIWNAEIAAQRFLRICQESKTHKTVDLFAEGPLSKE